MEKRGHVKESGHFDKPRTIRHWGIFAMVAAALVGLALVVTHRASSAKVVGTPVASIGNFTRVAKPRVSSGGKVPVFFLSALYCPFCAAERWPLAIALGRFGTWTDLAPSHSTTGVDGFSAIPTYDFLHAQYHSRYIDFAHRDVADAQGHALQTLSPAEESIVNRFDPGGGIPFLIIDGAYAQSGSGYSPGLLVHKPFAEVQAGLQTQAPDARAIRDEAEVLTALICHADGDRPTRVCTVSAVHALEVKIR